MKNYITLILILCTLLLAPEITVLKKRKTVIHRPIGIAPYTFRKSFPNGVAATLDTIKMMGFTEIEGGGGPN